jgi:hypothetical protein
MTYHRDYMLQAPFEGLAPGWADYHGAKTGEAEKAERHTAAKPARFSPAAREKMAASQRARWAEKKARGKTG